MMESKKFCVVFCATLALAACGGRQSQPTSSPYSNDLLNSLSQQPPMGGSASGAAASGAASEPSPSADSPVPSEPDAVELDATTSDSVTDAGPEASVGAGADAGRRRTGAAARPATRRDGGR
jgi:hypothetical protein